MNTPKGKFIISIDLEYAWGYVDRDVSPRQKEKIRGETKIINRLLALFDQYEIPATWAVVGKLLEEGDDPLWHDVDDVVGKIQNARVGHEIGSHSYAHIVYGESSRDEIEQDIERAREIHAEHDLPFDSFVFPRNSERGHDMLKKSGIITYRGKRKRWYEGLPDILRRFIHLKSYGIPFAATVLPSRHASGLINIPDSMLLIGRNGVRRLIFPPLIKLKATNGLRRAMRRGEIFHLWFHPSNFSYDTETQFDIFESILREADRLRSRGTLEIDTMGGVARNLDI
ncbi:MAG: polysaccharide deacetylase family protein [Candidatus Paceibacterota bacterium]